MHGRKGIKTVKAVILIYRLLCFLDFLGLDDYQNKKDAFYIRFSFCLVQETVSQALLLSLRDINLFLYLHFFKKLRNREERELGKGKGDVGATFSSRLISTMKWALSFL